ncbi:hypothetical protein LUZ61_019746 [Rhynchospora tenuis]|uniref:Small auxin up regulated protein n=1 Tax=Rhynchospora tenuis TaxID=198213 RepID=A0AAD5ZBX2_9POAL|nr:hypothetical protein LUZ61_019746 [Rhynchospora tenuis]
MGHKLYTLLTRFHLTRHHSNVADVPKGHFTVYVGDNRKRFVIPTAYLRDPMFLTLMRRVEEEFGFDNKLGGITIPCTEWSLKNNKIRSVQSFLFSHSNNKCRISVKLSTKMNTKKHQPN